MHCMMEEGAAGAGRWLDTNPCSTTLRGCHHDGAPALTSPATLPNCPPTCWQVPWDVASGRWHLLPPQQLLEALQPYRPRAMHCTPAHV